MTVLGVKSYYALPPTMRLAIDDWLTAHDIDPNSCYAIETTGENDHCVALCFGPLIARQEPERIRVPFTGNPRLEAAVLGAWCAAELALNRTEP